MRKKIILLTGSSGSIGSSIVKYFSKLNFKILGISRNNQLKLKNYFHYKFDLHDFDLYEKKITELVKEHGKIDYFIHSAGVLNLKPINIVDKKDIYNSFDINIFSAFLIIKLMKNKKLFNKKAGAVIISSIMSELGDSGMSLYSSSKAACLGLVRSAAIELSKEKKRVNCISPGTINNDMFKKFSKKVNSSKVNELKNKYPLGLGKNLDINLCIEYLISDNNNWITGQNIVLDGGFSLK